MDTLESKQLSTSLGLGGRLPLGTQYQLAASDAWFNRWIVTNPVFNGQVGITLTWTRMGLPNGYNRTTSFRRSFSG